MTDWLYNPCTPFGKCLPPLEGTLSVAACIPEEPAAAMPDLPPPWRPLGNGAWIAPCGTPLPS